MYAYREGSNGGLEKCVVKLRANRKSSRVDKEEVEFGKETRKEQRLDPSRLAKWRRRKGGVGAGEV